jgi:hypothetical protein
VLQIFAPFRLESGYVPRNQLASDPTTEFLPWLFFARDELAHGRFPLWSPFNGGGVPLFANYQAAVLSPFSGPFYLLSLEAALVVAAWVKVWTIALATYLFARTLLGSQLAALLSATAFAFCGYNSLLVAYPHTSVVALFPAVMWCAESALQRHEARADGTLRWWIALGAVLAASVYAGHPEVLFFGSVTLAAWVALRLVALARRGEVQLARTIATRFALTAAIAVLLGAPQLLPFFEYLAASSKIAGRAVSSHVALDLGTWPRYVFPDVLGSVVDGRVFAPRLPPPNYEAANLACCGALVTALAIVGLAGARRALLFASIVVAWPIWAHDVGGVAALASTLPVVRWIPIAVSQFPWSFALALLAGFALDRCLQRDGPRPRKLTVAWLVGCAALLLTFFFGAHALIDRVAAERNVDWLLVERAQAHIRFVSATFVVAALAFAALGHATRESVRRVLGITLVLCAFLQTAGVFARYQTTCDDRLVFPVTPGITALRDTVGNARCLFLTQHQFPPTVNSIYGVRQPASFDAVGIAWHDEVYRVLCDARGNWQVPHTASARALQILGVEYVVAPADLAGWSGDRDVLVDVAPFAGDRIHRFEHALGRFWLAGAAVDEPSPPPTLDWLRTDFDPSSTVVIARGPPRGERTLEATHALIERLRAQPRERVRGSVRVVMELPREIHLNVASERAAWLVAAQSWFPGWSATVDGREVELLRANHAFSALEVPAGTHDVVLRYAPRSWSLGLVSCALGVVLALGAIAVAKVRSRPASSLASAAPRQ